MKRSAPPVILLNPPSVSKRFLPTRFPPHGMATLYAGLSRQGLPALQFDRLMESLYQDVDGLDVHGRDRDLTEAEFCGYLDAGRGSARLTDFVDRHLAALPGDGSVYAFSVVSYYQLFGALLLASELSRRNPDAVIVLGGPCVSVKPAAYGAGFGLPLMWIKGCGIAPLSRLLRGEGPESLPGLVRFNGSRVKENSLAVSPAENEPAPDFTGLDMDAYKYRHPDLGPALFLPYRLTKGCPSACSFCSGRLVDQYSTKTPEKVASELTELTGRYESRNVMFTDASINAEPETFLKTCNMLASETPGLRWYAYARVRGFTRRMAEAAAAAGCFALFLGVESADPRTIKLLGKGFEPNELHRALEAASSAGIRSIAHLMFNTPWETREEVTAFLDLVERYDNDPLVEFMAQRFILEPETLLFSRPENYGLTRLRPLNNGFFDRTEYAYDMVGGEKWAQVKARHEANRKRLDPVLKRLAERVFPRDSTGTRLFRELM